MGNLFEVKNTKYESDDIVKYLNGLDKDTKHFINSLLGKQIKSYSYTFFDYENLLSVPNSEIDAESKKIFQDRETQEKFANRIKRLLRRNDSSKLTL